MPYRTEHHRSITEPEAFWAEQAADLDWFTRPDTVLSRDKAGMHRWFQGGTLNTAHLCLDHHVANGLGDQAAIHYDSPVAGEKRTITYAELRDLVARFAGALSCLGVGKGDRVVIYMPMVPEAVIAMLACARLGAVHSVVFGGFASHELAVRMDDAKPKVVVTASCGIEFSRVVEYKPLLDRALSRAKHKPARCVVLQRPQCEAPLVPGRDVTWDDVQACADPVECTPVEATDPLYILYTSGTTGKPKGVVRDNGGHAVALRYSMRTVYGAGPGDVFWAASDVGWVVGHSYIVYGPLLAGCATVLFEGKPVRTPDAGTFWRIMEEYRVNCFFTAPTAFRAVKKEDPQGSHRFRHDLSSLRAVFLAGERLDPATHLWLVDLLDLPVLDHWWQTESGWPMVANSVGLGLCPVKTGSAGLPVPGYDVRVLDGQGRECGPGEHGHIVVRLPLPPGCLPTLHNDRERFCSAYLERFPGHYLTGDGGYKDQDGHVFVMGRTDDVINVAGHRLSTGEMEELLAAHPDVAECAVIGVRDDMRGQVPLGFVVLKDGTRTAPERVEDELVDLVRREIGAFACLRRVCVVERLPKTRSGKILRAVMRKLADGEGFETPSTIDDVSVLDELRETMARDGLAPDSAAA
jgi:acyl-coenzyme A synthetase/AMP-(fatty) acid ligase